MKQKSVATAKAVQMMDGVVRKTLSYNQKAMLCHIELKKGATIPLHHHDPVQIGMCLCGKLRFFSEKPENEFIATEGESYVMDSNEPHGAEALEDSVLLEAFAPTRPEYQDF